MRRTARYATLPLALALVAGCGEQGPPTEPPLAAEDALSLGRGGTAGARTVQMLDNCDPASFNAVLGEGTCTRPGGGVTFEKFFEQLEKHREVASWRFSPTRMQVRAGATLVAINRGGEAHTFTPVADFGGGFIPELNAASGNLSPAPECLAIGSLVFVPPGASVTEHAHGPGVHRYQCCLHPWMRTTVEAR